MCLEDSDLHQRNMPARTSARSEQASVSSTPVRTDTDGLYQSQDSLVGSSTGDRQLLSTHQPQLPRSFDANGTSTLALQSDHVVIHKILDLKATVLAITSRSQLAIELEQEFRFRFRERLRFPSLVISD